MTGLYANVARFLNNMNVTAEYVGPSDDYEEHLMVESVRVFAPRYSDVRCWEIQAGKRYMPLSCRTAAEVAAEVASILA